MDHSIEVKNSIKSFFRNILRNKGFLVIFLFIVLIAAVFIPNFLRGDNFVNILSQAAIPMITCLGMTFVLMTGGIDLSMGYSVGFCSYIFGYCAVQLGVPVGISVVLAMLMGGLWGLVNGLLVKLAKIPAFIVTLGTGYVIYGAAQIISNGQAIDKLPKEVLALGRTQILGLPTTVYFALAVVIVCYIIVHRATFGRSLSAVGYNSEAVRLSGINTNRLIISVYVLSGLLTGLAASLMSIRVNQAYPVMGGTTYTFEAITAAILGGASLNGGVGSAIGSVFGVLTMFVITNCLGLLGVNKYVYQAVLSIVILIAIIFENLKNRRMQ